MVIAALGWFLLKELASVLRPLLMAVILAYVLMPYHSRLRKHVSAPVSLVLLASFTVGLLIALALAVQMSVLELSKELPVFQDRVIALVHRVQDFAKLHVPGMVDESAGSAGEQLAAMETRAERRESGVEGIGGVMVSESYRGTGLQATESAIEFAGQNASNSRPENGHRTVWSDLNSRF